MNAPEEVPLPTPDPSPEVTDITVEQERQNIVTAALRNSLIADLEAALAEEHLSAMNPTAAELRAAYNTWVIQ
jgi:hypothetical protein